MFISPTENREQYERLFKNWSNYDLWAPFLKEFQQMYKGKCSGLPAGLLGTDKLFVNDSLIDEFKTWVNNKINVEKIVIDGELKESFDKLMENLNKEAADDLDGEMYDFVYHFMPWFVYNLKPERKYLLDDEGYIEINCPCGFKFQKLEIGDKTCRVITLEKSSFLEMEIPMCMIVTANNDDELLGYFTVESLDGIDFIIYVPVDVSEKEYAYLGGSVSWEQIPTVEQFARDVVEKYVNRKEKNSMPNGIVYRKSQKPNK